MKLFALLSVAFCIGAQALPAAVPEAVPAVRTLSSSARPLEKRASLIKSIDKELDKLGLELDDTITQLVDALGLSAVDSDVDSLLEGLVGDVDQLDNEIDDLEDSLLDDLGLSELVTTIDDLEKALGLSPTNTIGDLLKSLHLLK